MIKLISLTCVILIASITVRALPADTTKPGIKAIEVVNNNPMFGESFYRIFHVGPITLYQSQYQFDSNGVHSMMDSAGNWVSNKFETRFSEMRNCYFVFHRDSSYGYQYYENKSGRPHERLQVDTRIQNIRGTNNFENLSSISPNTLTWNTEKTELVETFIQKASKDTPEIRFNFYYKSGLKFIHESLNPVLDSVKKMKLYKFEFQIGEFYDENTRRLIPAMKFSYEMKEIFVPDPSEVMFYINRYKTSILGDKSPSN